MTRTLLSGGRVFDGTGSPPRQADVLVEVEDGRILEVGPGRDGDEAVDVGGRHLLPGLFDCHTHVTLSHINLLGMLPLAPGRRADVVVVDGDPFELATLPDRIAAVVKDGRLVAGHV